MKPIFNDFYSESGNICKWLLMASWLKDKRITSHCLLRLHGNSQASTAKDQMCKSDMTRGAYMW